MDNEIREKIECYIAMGAELNRESGISPEDAVTMIVNGFC